MTRSRMYWTRAIIAVLFLFPGVWMLVREFWQEDPFGPTGSWIGSISIGATGIVMLVVVWALTGRSHRRFLFSDAPVIRGTLQRIRATGTEGSGTEQCEMLVAAIDPSGRAFEGVVKEFINIAQMGLLRPGTAVELAYLPGDRLEFRHGLDAAGNRVVSGQSVW